MGERTGERDLRAKAMKRRRRARVMVVLALVLAIFLVDQLGVRRLSGTDFPIRDPLGRELARHVETLATPAWGGRYPGTEGALEASRYLAGELAKIGVKPLPSIGDYALPLAARPELGPNIVGWIPGADASSVIVLGAHYDHLGATKDGVVLGADDNASSVAVVLGAAQELARSTPARSIAIAFYDTEESPFFGTPAQGSRSFAFHLPREIPSLASVRLAIALDLVGGVVWRPSADVLFACGADKTPGLGDLVDSVREPDLDVRQLGIHLVEDIPGFRSTPVSDYDVFRQQGVPFLFLSTGRSPRYHRPADLPPTLYYDRMARTARWLARLVTSVASSSAPLRFDPDALDLARDRATMIWAMDAATTPWSTVPGTGPISFARLLGDRSRVHAAGEGRPFDANDKLALERASFRLQCLIYGYPICFTL